MGTDTVPPYPTTPRKASSAPLVSDTPSIRKQTSEYCTRDSDLSISRRAVANDFGQIIPQVDLAYFEECILPPLPRELDLTKLLDKLKSDNIIYGNRWNLFQNDPKDMKGTEDQVFSNLVPLITAIVVASTAGLRDIAPRLEYRSRPRNDMSTIYENKPSKPDGYFVAAGRERRDGRLYWYQVGVPGEYKLQTKFGDCIDVSGAALRSSFKLNSVCRIVSRPYGICTSNCEKTPAVGSL